MREDSGYRADGDSIEIMSNTANYRFTDLVAACQSDWQAYIQHDFVARLGDATLPRTSFQHYLKQDYLFLIHFARAYALAAYKSRSLADLRQAHEGLKAILDLELGLRAPRGAF